MVKTCSRAGELFAYPFHAPYYLTPLCLSNCGNKVKALKRNLEGRYQQEGSKTETASETGNNFSVQPTECTVVKYPDCQQRLTRS